MGINSQSRGKDASGLAILRSARIDVLKSPSRFSRLYSSEKSKTLLSQSVDIRGYVGHTRMQTHGSFENMEFNHPIVRRDWLLFHNGIVVNQVELTLKFKTVPSESDTATVANCLDVISSSDLEIIKSHVELVFRSTQGANTFVAINKKMGYCFFWSSNGSLYFLHGKVGTLLFASEKATLMRVAKKEKYVGKRQVITQFPKNTIFSLSYETTSKINEGRILEVYPEEKIESSSLVSCKGDTNKGIYGSPLVSKPSSENANAEKLILDLYNKSRDDFAPRLCSHCLLPETYPTIKFADTNICDGCIRFERYKLKPLETLVKSVFDTSRGNLGVKEVLVPVSGGRDSSFVLHYLTRILGLRTVAYTYDWGFVTDQARENVSRMCGELSVEHILIAGDIQQKRRNVSKNLHAWIAKPHLGMVPLFMAGDKAFFYHSSKLVSENNFGLAIWGMNRLEVADFKSYQSGASKQRESRRIDNSYDLSLSDKGKMLGFNISETIKNPKYLNLSLFDTLFGFFSYYMKPVDYLQFFDFYRWNESEIYELLVEEYGLKLGNPANRGWRMGDATAPFYNFLYTIFLGYNENNILVANLLRDGQINLEQARKRLEVLDYPDVEGITNYLRLVGLSPTDFLGKLRNHRERVRKRQQS